MSKILVACGGSLGHINPGLSFIEKLKVNNKRCYLLTTKSDYEKFEQIRNNQNIEKVFFLDVKGINRKNIFKMIYTLIKYIKCIIYILSIIKKVQPSLIISTGGFVGGLSVIAARFKKIPYILHEQNACFGLANKLFLKKAKIVFTSFSMNLPNGCLMGNPRMIEAIKIRRKTLKPGFNKVLVISGSLGAKRINDCLVEYLKNEKSFKYDITLVTGKKYYQEVLEKIEVKGNHFRIVPFLENSLEEMAKSNLIISRSGATTLFEIIGLNVPTILIPSPNVTNNHQYHNAEMLKECILEEKDLNVDSLDKKIEEIINSERVTKKLINYSDFYYDKYMSVDWSTIFE